MQGVKGRSGRACLTAVTVAIGTSISRHTLDSREHRVHVTPRRDDTYRRAAMEAANLPTLVAVLYQLTGDGRWLAEPYRPERAKGMDDNDTGGFPEQVAAEIRGAAAEAVRAWEDGRPAARPAPVGDELVELLSACMGEQVPAEFEPMMAETLGFRAASWRVPQVSGAIDFSVAVIGAGISGLLAATRLRHAGIEHVVLERNDDVGGTWLENRYPGAGVDTPSYLYSYSFHPRRWSSHFGKRDEVEQYLRDVAADHALYSNIRFGTEVVAARWEAAAQRWTVTTVDADGHRSELTAHAVITATGQLNRPKIPDLPGMERFAGPLFHSARWPEDLDVAGKRVAVVGTGASAMQIVPAIADRVAELTVFQRSPQWIAPNDDYFRPISDERHWLMDNVPFYQSWYRARLAWTFNDTVHPSLQIDPDWPHPERSVNAVNDAHRRFFTRYLESELDGREDLQRKALPAYPPFGKRMLLDNGWFRALRRDNVELVTDAVAEVTPTGVRSADGHERDVDVIVLATGFDAHRLLAPIDIRGRSGASIRDVWGDDDASAYLGITVPDFPNLFLVSGPNTATGHGGSQITIIEFQLDYILDLLSSVIEKRLGAVEVRPEVAQRYQDEVDAAHNRMIWTHRGMDNWYRNSAGRVVSTLPWRIVDYRDKTAAADLDDFRTEPARRLDRAAG